MHKKTGYRQKKPVVLIMNSHAYYGAFIKVDLIWQVLTAAIEWVLIASDILLIGRVVHIRFDMVEQIIRFRHRGVPPRERDLCNCQRDAGRRLTNARQGRINAPTIAVGFTASTTARRSR